jgi:CHAT domain-containing protein
MPRARFGAVDLSGYFRSIERCGWQVGLRALICIGWLGSCRTPDTGRTGEHEYELFGTVSIPRVTVGRLSVRTAYGNCTSAHQPESIAVGRCASKAPTPDKQVIKRVSSAQAALATSAEDDDLRVVGLSDLVYGYASGKTLDRSISFLRMAARSRTTSQSATLSDLSAAYLLRAEKSQDARDIFAAVELADSSLRVDPANELALFNLALALEASGLHRQSIDKWRSYLKTDSSSSWGKEAKTRLRILEARLDIIPRKPSDPSTQSLIAFARRNEQDARAYGWNELLPRWAQQIAASDEAGANRSLAMLRSLASTAIADGGDSSLARAIQSIESQQNDRTKLARLARAHAAFGRSQQAYRSGSYDSAEIHLRPFALQAGLSQPLSYWIKLYHGAALVYTGKSAEGMAEIQQVERSSSTCAINGTSKWMLGTTLMRRGEYETASSRFGEASAAFSKCREYENVALLNVLQMDAWFKLGDATTGYSYGLKAAHTLTLYPSSVWTHNLFAIIASSALDDGFADMAMRFQTEGLRAAISIDRPIYIAEAHLARAKLAGRVSDEQLAKGDLETASGIIGRMSSGLAREWFSADLQVTRAEVARAGSKQSLRPGLDSAVFTFGNLKNALRLVPALLTRADAALDAHDLPSARADLASATKVLESEGNAVSSTVLRQSVFRAARDVFERGASVSLSIGDTVGALGLLETGRTSFGPTFIRPSPSNSTWEVPPGRTAVTFLYINDTLSTWVVKGRSLRLIQHRLNGYNVRDSVFAMLQLLESGKATQVEDAALRRLYRILIEPVSSSLGDSSEITFIGDDWISATPFAALRNPHNDRYLIEDHTVSVAPNLRSVSKPARLRKTTGSVLLVGDPLIVRRHNEEMLEPLPGAVHEIAAIKKVYPLAIMLSGSAASAESVSTALQRAEVFHFAGHAINDPLRPMNSHLIMASVVGSTSNNGLAADRIQRMSLRNLRLVVLSACETMRQSTYSTMTVNGLTIGFLSAGARGVVGSLWKVGDEPTQALMTDFHAAYRTDQRAARALRYAQLKMITSSNATFRSPGSWAAFQFVGQ